MVLMLTLIGITLYRGRHVPHVLFPFICGLVHCMFSSHRFFTDPGQMWYLILLPMFVILSATIKEDSQDTPIVEVED